MGEVLVLVDHADGVVRRTTAELLTIARRLGAPSAVLLGAAGDETTAALARYGAEKVYQVDQPDLADQLVLPKVAALTQLVARTHPVAVLLASGAENKEVAGRLAIRTASGPVTDAVDLDDQLVTTQSVFAGGYTVRARVTRGVPIVTLKPNSVTPLEEMGSAAVEVLTLDPATDGRAARIVERRPRPATGRPDLAEAPIVVAGGRGVGSAENFTLVERLADALGGAVGASRAAVDSGWYPHAHQVGQTGKTVSPQLYVALGISGAIQHRSGMQTAKTVVVVNKDEQAPIFELADFGLVGDVNVVVPAVVEEIERRRQ